MREICFPAARAHHDAEVANGVSLPGGRPRRFCGRRARSAATAAGYAGGAPWIATGRRERSPHPPTGARLSPDSAYAPAASGPITSAWDRPLSIRRIRVLGWNLPFIQKMTPMDVAPYLEEQVGCHIHSYRRGPCVRLRAPRGLCDKGVGGEEPIRFPRLGNRVLCRTVSGSRASGCGCLPWLTPKVFVWNQPTRPTRR